MYRKPEFSRRVLHPWISISSSVGFMLAMALLFARVFGDGSVRMVTIVLVVVAPVIEALVGNVLYAERAGVGHRVRELVVALLLSYVALSLMRHGPLLARFAPSLDHLAPLVSMTCAWALAFGMHNRLRGREALLRTFDRKNGEELRHTVVDRQQDMAVTVRELRGVRGLIVSFLVITAVFAVLVASGLFPDTSLPPGSAPFILLCVHVFTGIVSIALLNAFIDEYAANGIGLAVPLRLQRKRAVAATVVVVVAVALAFLFSRPRSVLDLELIANFFRWLSGLFENEPGPPPPQPVSDAPRPDAPPSLLEMLADFEPREPPLWLRLFALMLRRLALTVLVAGVVLLVFGPMFSPAFRSGLRRLHPLRSLRRLAVVSWKRLKVLLRWLRFRLAHRGQARPDASREPASTRGAARAGRWTPSVRKQRQMDRVVAVFARICEWGEKNGVVYRPAEGACEYLSRLVADFPERAQAAQVCGSIFWEARYSTHVLKREQMREYARAAKRITGAG